MTVTNITDELVALLRYKITMHKNCIKNRYYLQWNKKTNIPRTQLITRQIDLKTKRIHKTICCH